MDAPGRPILFGTTEEFLRCFGVSSIEQLPDIDEVQKQNFMEEAMEEVRKIHVDAPVKMNQVVVSHFLGTDVDLIASRSMSKKEA